MRNAKRKAQITIEFFFVLTLFALLLYWLNYFSGTAKTSAYSTTLLAQERVLANDVAALADQACLENASISFPLPCFFGANSTNYVLVLEETSVKVFPETPSGSLVEKNVSCRFDGASLEVVCAGGETVSGKACFKKTGDNAVNFSLGECA